MNILFLHQNMPGQFRHLAPALARDSGNQVVFLTRRGDVELPGVRRVTYAAPRAARADVHPYLRTTEEAVLLGQQVVRACLELGREGFRPDVVVAHPGWGESLFIKDVCPRARVLCYCEYYYHSHGADIGFDPGAPTDIDTVCRARMRNAHLLLSLQAADRGWSPTEWQRHRHPPELLPRIAVVHDGIDTRVMRPDAEAAFALPDGRLLTAADEVVTYTARNLEPYRGFPSFMRALPNLLRRRPEAQVVVVGGDATSYGPPPAQGRTWRETMLEEIGPVDVTRVHLLPRVPYGDYRSLLQISRLHVYLTVPFVLSWSCLEAMACGAVVLGSRTAPVEEVIEDGRNGFLTDFFDHAQLAADAAELLEKHDALRGVREAARATVLARYGLERCLPEQIRMVRSLGR
jgi:glycosyltransferase involved in cell wall biosynthesis